jgi:diguanylate cyclase (GGDEF)-like protein
LDATATGRTKGAVQLASSHLITTCATFAAITIFVATGSQVLTDAFSVGSGHASGDNGLTVAFLLNIAIILFGWRRSKDLKEALEAYSRAEQAAHENAFTDHTTGLANRRELMRVLAEAADGVEPSTLLLLDLDYFKKVNDLHGHVAGDRLLKSVAETLRQKTPAGSCCARLGGDEFAVLLRPGQDEAGIDRTVDDILRGISDPVALGNTTLNVSASAGLSRLDATVPPEDALRRADIAMYTAKRTGRNCHVWFDQEMEMQLQVRMELEEEIRVGIAAGQFVPFYQPQICLDTGELTGFEVLARWNSPTRGLVEPEGFLTIAEASGLIGPLSMNVARQALVEARDWPEHLRIAINVSPVQFRDRHLAERILKLLTETNFPPARLEVEITETSLLEDRDLALATVQSLKNTGISISLDDFGTGYASLSQLRSLPFDRIKIDRSFVASLLDDVQSDAIVSTIASLGQALSLPITAEGIESDRIRERLATLGCSDGQGWLFGKAVPGRVIAEHLGTSPTGRVQREIGGASDAEPITHERRDQLRRPSRPRKIA